MSNQCSNASCMNGSAAILLGNGDGTFQAPTTFSTGCRIVAYAIYIPNRDQFPALVCGNLSRHAWEGSISVAQQSRDAWTDGHFHCHCGARVQGGGGDRHDDVLRWRECARYQGSGERQAKFTTSALTLGHHSITAAYSGNSSYVPRKSSALAQTVMVRTTKTSLKSSLNPALVGDSVIFTATVTSTVGHPPDGNTVTFADGGVVIGSASLSNGIATLTTTFGTTGPHSITAGYLGTTDYAPSTSIALTEKVRAASSTSLTSSPNPSAVAQNITFTATVTSTSGTPNGSVTFRADGALLGTKTLSGGVASIKSSSLLAGSHSVTATFNGSTYFLTSSSGLTQTVK